MSIHQSQANPIHLVNVPLSELMSQACSLRDRAHGAKISYSRKVFIPLTHLCRDVCAYCTFATPPQAGKKCFLTPEEVVAIAASGQAQGCNEALFTLGDKPELRYRAAREELASLGFATTLDYLIAMCQLVLDRTGLLPHANAGVMSRHDIERLRNVTVSQGLMLESGADRLCVRGGPHFGSPDKVPARRLEMIRAAGEASVPFTSGLLIGIGETRSERISALLSLRDIHARFGHLQEIIVQNFRAKAGTRMAHAPEPNREELLWTIAVARIIFGPDMNIQAPPNLSGDTFGELIDAGINDWGGISPVTPDHVNPANAWPALEALEAETARRGKTLVERLAVYPSHIGNLDQWQAPVLHTRLLSKIDAEGYVREGSWRVGSNEGFKGYPDTKNAPLRDDMLRRTLDKTASGGPLDASDIVTLFSARGPDFEAVCSAADALRIVRVGSNVTYVVNRNINYTNICFHKCTFCAFSKGDLSEQLRGPAYDLDMNEVTRRVAEAWSRGATEVCMQGGIHPHYTGETYLELLRAAKKGAPDIHIHAFSPLEIRHGASTSGMRIEDFLQCLKDEGLSSLPGTAAEILDDTVRAVLCPDKLNSQEWLYVMEAAHAAGLRTTATIMFGHIDNPSHWARHLIAVRDLQSRTGGFTEFVPLPYVSMESPLFLRGQSRPGPTFREAMLMHAVARLVFDPLITNIQASWVKLGEQGVITALAAGANDLGGTLMNESISKAAGALHGQEWSPEKIEHVIRGLGRMPRQRTTLYAAPSEERRSCAFGARPLAQISQTAPARRTARVFARND